jgi:hypothetical protein
MTINNHILIALVLLSPMATYATEFSDKKPPSYAALIEHLSNNCPGTVQQALEKPDVKSFTSYNLADIKGVCSCTEREVKKDKKLKLYLNVEPQLHVSRIGEQKTQSYITGVTYTSMLKCMLPVFNKSLSDAKLSK